MHSDVLIVGGGIAGLATALRIAPYASVALVLKGGERDSLSYLAQGGVAAAVGPGDSPADHARDTHRAGHGACREQAVQVLTQDGPTCMEELLDWGVPFDRTPTGELALAQEGAHSRARILRCQGDRTGAVIQRVLVERLQSRPGLTHRSDLLALELVVEDGECRGVRVADAQGRVYECRAHYTVLATGGAGQVYAHTTNPVGATGDGTAMAARAGAELRDMEFVQFHPTALAAGDSPHFLISEAVRGEGAILVNAWGERFLPPEGELGPRDVVARAVYAQQEAGPVYLDATHLQDSFATRFPAIFAACCQRGIDPRYQRIPVTPAAHFMMGGIATDVWGRTTLARLYAVGEAASTGAHGANRLAGNSLLEGLVFSRRVALHISRHFAPLASLGMGAVGAQRPPSQRLEAPRQWLQQLMWAQAGVIRQRGWLEEARQALEPPLQGEERDAELGNLRRVAQSIVAGALARPKSLGAHYILPKVKEGAGPPGPQVHA